MARKGKNSAKKRERIKTREQTTSTNFKVKKNSFQSFKSKSEIEEKVKDERLFRKATKRAQHQSWRFGNVHMSQWSCDCA